MNTQYIKYMLLPAALISSVAVAQEEETQSEQVNVAFRKVAAEDVLGGISSINYEEIAAKNTEESFSISNIQGYTSGFNGSSLWGMSDYLVLVDGVPRPADSVKPEEIASVTFMKGANAVVLYGSRAANGAILITTKRGKQGDIQIDVHANTGWHTIKALPKYLGSAEYMTLYNTVDPGKYSPESIYAAYAGNMPWVENSANNDFYSSDYIKKAYNRWEVVTEFKGGGERARYYSNIGYNRSGSDGGSEFVNFGNAKNNYKDRLNVRGNVDMNLADWITAYVDANATFYTGRSTRGTNFWSGSAAMLPNRFHLFLDPAMVSEAAGGAQDALKNAVLVNGMLLGAKKGTDQTNFVADIYRKGINHYYSRNFQFTAGINLDLERVTKGLSFKTMVGVDYSTVYQVWMDDDYRTYSYEWSSFSGKPEITGLNDNETKDVHSGNQSVGSSTFKQTIAFNAHFDYDRSFGDHNVSAMLLANGFQQTQSGVYHATSNANLGLNVDYNYAHKYYAQFGSAVVHSAKLAPGHRNAFNYAVTLGYNIAKESFMEGGIFDDLTISASHSQLNQDIDMRVGDNEYYLYAGNFDNAGGSWWTWSAQEGRESTQSRRGENLALTFIKRIEYSASIRASLLNKSLKLNASVFTNAIEGKPMEPTTLLPVYFAIGYPSNSFNPVYNFNNDKRYGFEIGVNYNKKFGEVELGLGANLTWYNTKATRREEATVYGDDLYRYRQGKPLDTIWGLEVDRSSGSPFLTEEEVEAYAAKNELGAVRAGDLKYKDQNGDGVINAKDEVDLGRSGSCQIRPDAWSYAGNPLSLGVNFTAKYKNLTLFVLATGGFGAKANKLDKGTYFKFAGENKYSIYARDTWGVSQNPIYPRISKDAGDNNYRTSDFWLYKTDRFDIAKIQLTYDCPSSWFQNQRVVSGVSLFVNANSVFTFAPEKELLELNVGSAPTDRFFQGGLTVTF